MTAQFDTFSYSHKTVLLHETVEALGDVTGGIIVDCTLGGGGHTRLLLERAGSQGKVIAFDRDRDAIENARKVFEKEIANGQLVLVDAPFSALKTTLETMGLYTNIRGIIADIGVSSHQIDRDERGFSFMADGPLDMRMDNRSGESASDFLGRADEQEIAQVLWELGEEQKSRQIARLIVQRRVNRPILRTLDLASLISNARLWKERSKKHPATKTFQALRIYVNDELGELRTLIGDAFDALSVGGVLAIISFHSLEDRIIKGRFNDLTGKTQRALIPRDLPLTGAEIDLMVERRGVIIGKFPTEPTDDEIAKNPRARSAKLRAIKKT